MLLAGQVVYGAPHPQSDGPYYSPFHQEKRIRYWEVHLGFQHSISHKLFQGMHMRSLHCSLKHLQKSALTGGFECLCIDAEGNAFATKGLKGFLLPLDGKDIEYF